MKIFKFGLMTGVLLAAASVGFSQDVRSYQAWPNFERNAAPQSHPQSAPQLNWQRPLGNATRGQVPERDDALAPARVGPHRVIPSYNFQEASDSRSELAGQGSQTRQHLQQASGYPQGSQGPQCPVGDCDRSPHRPSYRSSGSTSRADAGQGSATRANYSSTDYVDSARDRGVQHAHGVQSKSYNSLASASLPAPTSRRLGFRAPEWQSIKAVSVNEAKETIAALQKIGCEVETRSRGRNSEGSVDVHYRCIDWRSIAVVSDQLVNQWSTWLSDKGMEAIVINPTTTSRNAKISYRLLRPQEVRMAKSSATDQIINTLEMLDCDVDTQYGSNYTDLTFACPEWKTIAVDSAESQASWRRWLEESGLETR